jgi:uncharacterized protein
MAESGFYPYQAGIDAYGNGGFRFAGMSHRGPMLALPTGMFAWDIEPGQRPSLASLAPVLEIADQLDVLLIGMGEDIAALDPAIRPAFRERSVIVEAVATGAAVRTYNVLFAEKRAVGAALIAVDSIR